MTSKFKVTKATVMNFSRLPDVDGICIPPECYVKLLPSIPVIFDDPNQTVVGSAKVRRVGNRLYADMEITSAMKPVTKAFALIQKLYPGTVFRILDSHEHVILSLELRAILVGPGPNADDKIKPLGERVSCLTAKADLH